MCGEYFHGSGGWELLLRQLEIQGKGQGETNLAPGVGRTHFFGFFKPPIFASLICARS
jgi:hypothetical protein